MTKKKKLENISDKKSAENLKKFPRMQDWINRFAEKWKIYLDW